MPSKAKILFRKWNRIIHRDFGYFFFGITIIYSISGIAVNHKSEWNPNYIISQEHFSLDRSISKESIDNTFVLNILEKIDKEDDFKKYYFPDNNHLKVFLTNASSITLNLESGKGYLETIKKRPFFFEFNFLHYNPGRWWVWFSDIYAFALILISISGILILTKGKNSLGKRGIWFILGGLVIPILAIIFL
ncbi:MAG: hypothetical protein A2X64_05050 [Ignavibacteria bacterium GWF2_33_9]|nr:MAG: hypothetical protein A2X64_05050 [Ignavibacteria bacterium GWF2_33_9]